jgi:2-keto-4-pentenoate hydratase/2-oxohepta-3-ene-1,7-dioic acid hydratase in catechol pathway
MTKRLVKFLDKAGTQRWGLLPNLAKQPRIGDWISPVPNPLATNTTAYKNTDLVEICKLLPALPFDRPPSIFCIGLNYKLHAAECGLPEPLAPVVFMKNTSSVCGDGDMIVVPKCAQDPLEVSSSQLFNN